MAHDWAQDVKKYVASPDDAAIKGIVRHLGIAACIENLIRYAEGQTRQYW